MAITYYYEIGDNKLAAIQAAFNKTLTCPAAGEISLAYNSNTQCYAIRFSDIYSNTHYFCRSCTRDGNGVINGAVSTSAFSVSVSNTSQKDGFDLLLNSSFLAGFGGGSNSYFYNIFTNLGYSLFSNSGVYRCGITSSQSFGWITDNSVYSCPISFSYFDDVNKKIYTYSYQITATKNASGQYSVSLIQGGSPAVVNYGGSVVPEHSNDDIYDLLEVLNNMDFTPIVDSIDSLTDEIERFKNNVNPDVENPIHKILINFMLRTSTLPALNFSGEYKNADNLCNLIDKVPQNTEIDFTSINNQLDLISQSIDFTNIEAKLAKLDELGKLSNLSTLVKAITKLMSKTANNPDELIFDAVEGQVKNADNLVTKNFGGVSPLSELLYNIVKEINDYLTANVPDVTSGGGQ